VRLPIVFAVVGQVLLVPPHHAPIHARVELTVFQDGAYFSTPHVRRDGSFFMRRAYPGVFYFRVKPTRKPYCHTTAVRLNGGRGHITRIRITVPTGREHQCESSSLHL
jgi:hypothetical protein